MPKEIITRNRKAKIIMSKTFWLHTQYYIGRKDNSDKFKISLQNI